MNFYDESNDLVKNNKDNDFNDNKLTNIDSLTVNREPASDNDVWNKKYINDELDKNTLLRLEQTLQNYLKVSVGNDKYNLTKDNSIQIRDTTLSNSGITGVSVLPYWKIIGNDKNKNRKISNVIESTKTNSPSSQSGATSLPPIGNSFMHRETSSNNIANNVLVSWESW